MGKRFVSIWFCHLATDWFLLRQPGLRNKAFVLKTALHGKMLVTATNELAEAQGIYTGMAIADARAIFPSLEALDDIPGLENKLLHRIAEWCIRFTPVVSVDLPGGLLLDVTGCTHLWGSDELYIAAIAEKFREHGYAIRVAMAGTIGAAWAVARYGKNNFVIGHNQQTTALLSLPAASLRLEQGIVEQLDKLGLRHVRDFIAMPRTALRRRFGATMLERLDQAIGHVEEVLQPVRPVEPYMERLPCPEPIVTATGIEIALKRLLELLCLHLQKEAMGLRAAVFKCFRVDGKIINIEIGTNRPSHNPQHLFKLFEIKLPDIEPGEGIELFVLTAPKAEKQIPLQESIWETSYGLENNELSELLDRLTCKIGMGHIHRYLPDEHYWPERSIKPAASLSDKPTTVWKPGKPRPLQLLSKPELVDVTAPIPDYPPMLFRYRGTLHKIIRADGPERIEQEWWIQEGQHRDYYRVEDEQGNRYWLFRSGHYSTDKTYQWFIHGFFA